MAMTFSAPGGVGAAFGEMLFLAGQSLDVTRPLLAVNALHRLAFVVGFDPGELAVLEDGVSNPAVGSQQATRPMSMTYGVSVWWTRHLGMLYC